MTALPTPPLSTPERFLRDQEAAARAKAAPPPGSDTEATRDGSDRTHSRPPEPALARAPLPARVWVLVEGQVQEWIPEPVSAPDPEKPVPSRRS